MATLLPQNSTRFLEVDASRSCLDIYASDCFVPYTTASKTMPKQHTSINCWRKQTAVGNWFFEELERQKASHSFAARTRYARVSGEAHSTDTESENWLARNPASIASKEKRLYKTELCRSWEETGRCRYAGKCQYAHGREELKAVSRHPKFKTEVCCTFVTIGTCPYGRRCRFIHKNVPITAVGKQVHTHSAHEECLISCANSITASSRRLPIFVKFSRGLEGSPRDDRNM